MKLNIEERLRILNGILPRDGSIVTLRVIAEALDVLGLSSEEIQEWSVVESGGTVAWNRSVDTTIDIPISDAAHGIIVTELKRLSEADKLTIAHLPLWERFVENGG